MTMLRALFLFAGSGGGSLGFKRRGIEHCGAVDIDPLAARDYEMLTGHACTVADLDVMTPEQLRDACDGRPDVVFTSPPCKAFSGCLSADLAATEKYQRMNSLTLRGIMVACEAWETPPDLFIMENVPKIMSRGVVWLERIEGMLRGYGYAVNRTTRNLGEIGELAQRRNRFMLTARHMERVPSFMRHAPKKKMRKIGDVLGELPVPVPGSTAGGPMHRLPQLAAINWVRLALIPAGGDWRDLPPEVELRKRAARQNGGYGVEQWSEPAHGVMGHHNYRSTWGSVADPRVACERREGGHGVKAWDEQSAPVIGFPVIDNWPAGIADPRIGEAHHGCYGVEGWDEAAATVRATGNPRIAISTVADPRVGYDTRNGAHGVGDWEQPSTTIRATQSVRNGTDAVADPRLSCAPAHVGHYGVQEWQEPSHTIRAHCAVGNGPASVADPRLGCEPQAGAYGVEGWTEASHCITAHSNVGGSSRSAVADPRLPEIAARHDGTNGVQGWDETSHTVTGQHGRRGWDTVADPREPGTFVEATHFVDATCSWLVAGRGKATRGHTCEGKGSKLRQQGGELEARAVEKWVLYGPPVDLKNKRPIHMVIRALDGTWHRPITTLELAALQSFPTKTDDGEWLVLHGSQAQQREHIGNAVPPAAAEAIAEQVRLVLTEARSGVWTLSSGAIWVRETEAELFAPGAA